MSRIQPWAWFIVAWVVLIAGLTWVIVLCVRNAPVEVPITKVPGIHGN